MPDDLLVGGGHGSAHPVGGVHIGAEGIGVAVLAVLRLRGNGLPHIPGLACAVFHAGQVGGMGLVAIAGGVGAAAVGDEHQIVLDEVDGLLPAVLDIHDLPGDLLAALSFDDDIPDIHAILDMHTVRLQIFHQRQDHAFILVILGEAQGAEIGQAVDVMDIAAQIPFHLQSTGPTLESEHGLPIQPEVCIPEGIGQNIGYLLVLQILFRGHKQLGQGHGGVLVQLELLIRVGILTAVHAGAAQRIVGIVLVEPIILIQNRDARRLDGRNITEGVPHDLKMVVHLTAAPHKEALGDVLAAVAAAACQIQLFKYMDVLALHLSVADQIESGGQAGKAGADDISRFFVHILGLFGMSKGLVSASRVIHNKTSCYFFLSMVSL